MMRKTDESHLDDLLTNLSEAFGVSNITHKRDATADPPEDPPKVDPAEDVDASAAQPDAADAPTDVKPVNLNATPKPDKPKESLDSPEPVGLPELVDLPDPPESPDPPRAKELDPSLKALVIEVVKTDPAAQQQIVQFLLDTGREREILEALRCRVVVCLYEGRVGEPTEGEVYRTLEEALQSELVTLLVERAGVEPERALSALFVRHLYYADKNGEPIRSRQVSDADRAAFEAAEKTRSSSTKGTDASTPAKEGNSDES